MMKKYNRAIIVLRKRDGFTLSGLPLASTTLKSDFRIGTNDSGMVQRRI
jgi:hypothetical protein